MRRIGRIRKKLAAMLSEAGFALIEPNDLCPMEGFWRMMRADVNRWEATFPTEETYTDGSHRDVLLRSWDTMTQCVEQGFTVEPSSDLPGEYWINAKEKVR